MLTDNRQWTDGQRADRQTEDQKTYVITAMNALWSLSLKWLKIYIHTGMCEKCQLMSLLETPSLWQKEERLPPQ